MYIIVFTFELTATAYMAMVASILLVHSFGSCWLFMTFVDDITADVIVLNAYKRKKGSAVQLYEQLKEFIRFHSEIKQLSLPSQLISFQYVYWAIFIFFFRLLTKAGNTYSLIFTSNLLWTVSTLAVLLVTLQMELVKCLIFQLFSNFETNFICELFFLQLNVDTIWTRFTSHFKVNLPDAISTISTFGNLFWLWRGKTEIWWFGYLSKMPLVSISLENTACNNNNYMWISRFRTI